VKVAEGLFVILQVCVRKLSENWSLLEQGQVLGRVAAT
jgi:hypothetical protein